MKDFGYPQDVIALIGNMYSQSTTTYIGEYFGKTQSIPIQRGTIHGDTHPTYVNGHSQILQLKTNDYPKKSCFLGTIKTP